MKIVVNKPTITRKELEAVLDCLINDELAAGESVKTFESAVASLIGVKHALAVSSLTAAYHLAYCAIGLGAGDEVILPSFFTQPSLSALSLTGAKAVLVDSDSDSIFPSPDEIKARITGATKAVVVGHLFGYHYPITELRDAGVPVIEDISHAIGTEIDDIPCGKHGAIAVSSFNPCGIITTGNGGVALTGNAKYYSIMKDARGNGGHKLSFEYTMTDFQAAMGSAQIARLPELLTRRREIARIYHDSLKMTPHKPPFIYHDRFGYQTMPVIFNASNEKIEGFWRKQRIEVLRPLPIPLHQFCGSDPKEFPHSERFAKKLFSVPLYPTLSRRDVEKIAKSLANFV